MQQIEWQDEVVSASLSKRISEQQLPNSPFLPVSWIETIPNHPYFITDGGQPWFPIGQNEALTWPGLQGLFRRKDVAGVERYLAMLAANGVTCLRLMLEYSHGRHRYLESTPGNFAPNMVRFWDDLFALCAQLGLRILLTPYDTFWMWRHWKHHPYNKANGGPCASRLQWLLCPQTRAAIKQRLLFATQRWGGSGVLFAWDLWNELQPCHAGNSTKGFSEFVSDISSFLRHTELRLHGRAHLQTASGFEPVLKKHPEAAATIFRHPALQFASSHFYGNTTIDRPKNTVDAAVAVGKLTAAALSEIRDNRPFLDSEHGPIKRYHRGGTLPQQFDEEYFRHMQWAHAASGGAGGSFRWPYRQPHILTQGMYQAQKSLAGFLQVVCWQGFDRCNWNSQVQPGTKALVPFACGNTKQAVVYLLRRDIVSKNGMLQQDAAPLLAHVLLPFKETGNYKVTAWNTKAGIVAKTYDVMHTGGYSLWVPLPPIATDMALYIAFEL